MGPGPVDRLSIQKELLNWIGKPESEPGYFLCTYNLITQAVNIVDSGLAYINIEYKHFTYIRSEAIVISVKNRTYR